MMKRQQSGFTLLSVLVSVLIFSIGMLGIAGMYAKLMTTTTQDQNLTQVAALSNGLWGTIQASPSILASLPGTYNSGNVSSAPAQVRPWLTTATNALPSGSTFTITTGPDAAGTNTACDSASGCTINLTITWTQNASNTTGTVNRVQQFSYQYPI